jgi:hypothetical protein
MTTNHQQEDKVEAKEDTAAAIEVAVADAETETEVAVRPTPRKEQEGTRGQIAMLTSFCRRQIMLIVNQVSPRTPLT